MPKKKKFDRRIPPCPGDPKDYILVRGKYRYYWRLKRGTLKPALLNEVLTRSAANTSTSNRAAKQMMSLLSVFTQQMELGATITLIAGAFKRAYLKERMDFRFMHEIEFQENYPVHKLFKGLVTPKIDRGSIHLRFDAGISVRRLSPHAESYRFTAILLYGDPAKDRGIKIETEESPTYSFDNKKPIDCELSLTLPARNRPWMVLMHISCKLIRGMYTGPRYFAMWVVEAG